MALEARRQQIEIELIASENIVSRAVLRGVQYNDPTVEENVRARVRKLTSEFPLM
jgi:glycine/serine hydroxymethyltransferase